METLKNNPVALATLAPVIVYLAAAFGLNIDEDTAATVAGGVLVVGGFLARQLVRTRRTLPDPDAVKAPPPKTRETRPLP
jgi:hypothetical protein